jgi:hypothetical protein
MCIQLASLNFVAGAGLPLNNRGGAEYEAMYSPGTTFEIKVAHYKFELLNSHTRNHQA